MLEDPQECKHQAARCRELAAQTTDPLARKAYFGVADKFDALAEEIRQANVILMALNIAGGKERSLRPASENPEPPEITSSG